MNTGELELEYQWMKDHNPGMSDEQCRAEMFKRAMQATCDDLAAEVPQYDGSVQGQIRKYKASIR